MPAGVAVFEKGSSDEGGCCGHSQPPGESGYNPLFYSVERKQGLGPNVTA